MHEVKEEPSIRVSACLRGVVVREQKARRAAHGGAPGALEEPQFGSAALMCCVSAAVGGARGFALEMLVYIAISECFRQQQQISSISSYK
jgi:hypothetical protein